MKWMVFWGLIGLILISNSVNATTTLKLQNETSENLADFALLENSRGSFDNQALYIKFNASSIPSGVQILNAILYVYVNTAGGSSNAGFVMGSTDQDWSESGFNIAQVQNREAYTFTVGTGWKAINVNSSTNYFYDNNYDNYSYIVDRPDSEGHLSTNTTTMVAGVVGASATDAALRIGDTFTGLGLYWDILTRQYNTNAALRPYLNITYTNVVLINSSRITPTAPLDTQDLQGFCNGSHNQDLDITYFWKWYKDGVLNISGNSSPTNYTSDLEINVNNISSSNISATQQWILSCQAASDGLSSDWLNSSSVRVKNSNNGCNLNITIEDVKTQNQNASTYSDVVVLVEGFCDDGEEQLYLNDALITNPYNSTLGVGTHVFLVNTSGNENYTSNITGWNNSVIVSSSVVVTGGGGGGAQTLTIVSSEGNFSWSPLIDPIYLFPGNKIPSTWETVLVLPRLDVTSCVVDTPFYCVNNEDGTVIIGREFMENDFLLRTYNGTGQLVFGVDSVYFPINVRVINYDWQVLGIVSIWYVLAGLTIVGIVYAFKKKG